MAWIFKASAIFLVFPLSLAQQNVLGTTSANRQYTLDDIVPTTDQVSGHIKCCPTGTEFDGQACVLGVPICPPGSSREGRNVSSIQSQFVTVDTCTKMAFVLRSKTPPATLEPSSRAITVYLKRMLSVETAMFWKATSVFRRVHPSARMERNLLAGHVHL